MFPALLAAQRPAGVDRQLVAAALWAKARYNYAYWDAVRANWDSAFAATVTFAEQRPAPPDQLLFRRLRRWGALLPLAAGWKIRLTVSRAAFPDGKEFVGTGIVPDIRVDARVADVLAGRDAALARARAYLSETAGGAPR